MVFSGEKARREILYEEMHPYGTSAYRSADSTVEVSARRYRYTGKERDEETGLDYFGARYYAPWLGRWTTADPLGLQAGLNLYLYGRASPVVMVDPNGMDSEDFSVSGLVGAVGAGVSALGRVAQRAGRWDTTSQINALGYSTVEQAIEGVNQAYAADVQAQQDAEQFWRVASPQALAEFQIANITRRPPPGEAPPGFLRGFFREMTGEGVREAPFRGATGDVTTGVLADIANTAVRLGETGAETAVTASEDASDEAAGRFAFNFLKLASYAVGLGEVGAGAKAVQVEAAEAQAAVNAAKSTRAGSGYRYFAHGGPDSAVQSITTGGVKPVSIHTHKHPTGSFFTHELRTVDPSDLGFASAENWAVARGGSGGQIAVGRVPASVVSRLEARGLVQTGPVPGYPGFAPETVFHPKALRTLNKHVQWQVFKQNLIP